ncbi:hypothetical protein ASG90_13380 [Nocardioides sp. Soil797]|nr:hypothetical protein ASG90_13380 [Nocardioides sp. Soil797]
MIDFVDMLDQPGRLLDDASDDPSAPRHEHSPLWSSVAMMAIISLGGAISGYTSSHIDALTPTPPSSSDMLSQLQVEDLCRSEMLDLGIHDYVVPPFIPDQQGNNRQTLQPWQTGDTVKVVPERGRAAPADATVPTVACTIPND